MAVELVVPAVGESITEVQIGDWLVGEGQSANKEDALVVIETDKVTVELPAPVAGTVTRVLKQKGAKAAVGEVIGYIEAGQPASGDGQAARQPDPAAGGKSSSDAKSAQGKAKPDAKPAREEKTKAGAARDERTITPAARKHAVSEPRVMPAAARELAQSGLSASDVQASGPGGRVLKEDVQRHLEQPAPKAEKASAAAPPAPAPARGAREEEVVPMTMLRRRIAERLVEAQRAAALLTTFNEIDMSAVIALRKEHQEEFQKRHGVKLGFTSFFVKASIDALKLVPQINAEIRGESIVFKNYFDIGVAVGGGKGLVVPVLRDAERLSFAEVEKAVADLASRAQANKLSLDELQGGTFTISNGGIYGSLLSTPIVNPPQSGILGLHKIEDRAVVVGGEIVVRPMMYVAVTYDHRLVDGREAVTFLKRIKDCIENPSRMLLEI